MARNTRKTMTVEEAEKACWKAETDRRAAEAAYVEVYNAAFDAYCAVDAARAAYQNARAALDKAKAAKALDRARAEKGE
jgi:hypothetical protein